MKRLVVVLAVWLVLLATPGLWAETIVPEGNVSGTWTAAGSPYLIQGNIAVPSGSTLTIEPGVDVVFQGYYRLHVSGILEAIGTDSDSITFTPSDTTTGWRGLYYAATAITLQLSYCDIEYAHESGIRMQAVALNLQVSHCTIAHCRSVAGGGIYVSGIVATLDLSHSFIAYNTAECDTAGKGGGIYVRIGTLLMDSCTVHANRAVIPNEQYVYSVDGGGIYIGAWTIGVTISGSVISDNFIGLSDGGQSWGGYYGDQPGENGAGLYNCSEEPVVITNCLIAGNRANVYFRGGGGISTAPYSFLTTISHCDISQNWVPLVGAAIGGGLHARGSVDIVNCTFYANQPFAIALYGIQRAYHVQNTIVAYNAYGIFFTHPQYQSTVDIGYSNVIDICGYVPTGFGVLDTVNANGDSCDAFFNLFVDPMFVDTANGNLHLLAGSPCIDAGDPTSPNDPDGTVADMGCYYFDQLAGVPGAIHDLTIYRLGNDVRLRWSPITTDMQGNPITVAEYLIYAADEPFMISPGYSIASVLPPDTVFVHADALNQAMQFYNVRAVAE